MTKPDYKPATGRVCTLCGGVYITPCDGENESCGNRAPALARKAKEKS